MVSMRRVPQLILIGSTLLASWLGMQAVHELGHVLGAVFTGGKVERVVFHPLTISRTDLALNPHPLMVVWAGPLLGVLLPLLLWGVSSRARLPGAFVLRFFAGFCLMANGSYLCFGSFGDAGEMLRLGASAWQLWLFGVTTVPAGFVLWHQQGPHFGFGTAKGPVNNRVACATFVIAVVWLGLAFLLG